MTDYRYNFIYFADPTTSIKILNSVVHVDLSRFLLVDFKTALYNNHHMIQILLASEG